MGARLLAGLPEGSGITADLADDLAETPRQIVVLAVLNVAKVVHNIEDEDSRTTILRILSIEPFDGTVGDDLRAQLSARIEDRTGERALFDTEGAPVMDIPGTTTGDPAEYTRQLDLLRQEEAAKLREQADEVTGEEAMELEAQADAVANGDRDDELKARLAPAFSDGTQPTLASV